MKSLASVSVVCLLAACVYGQDVVTNAAGNVYAIRKVTRVEPDGVTFMHASGIVKLTFDELPAVYRERYGYDPTNAAAYQSDVHAKRVAYVARTEVHQAEKTAAASAEEARLAAEKKQAAEPKSKIAGKVLSVISDGIVLYDVKVERKKPDNWQTVNRNHEARGFDRPFSSAGDYHYVPIESYVVILCDPSGWYQGRLYSGTVSCAGTHTYFGSVLKAYR